MVHDWHGGTWAARVARGSREGFAASKPGQDVGHGSKAFWKMAASQQDDCNQVAPGDICAAVFYPHLRTYEDVMLSDLSLVDYIAVNKAAQLPAPHPGSVPDAAPPQGPVPDR